MKKDNNDIVLKLEVGETIMYEGQEITSTTCMTSNRKVRQVIWIGELLIVNLIEWEQLYLFRHRSWRQAIDAVIWHIEQIHNQQVSK